MTFDLHNEDCLRGMKKLKAGSVGLIVADLPFGITQNEWDTQLPIEPLWKQFRRVLKPDGVIAMFAQEPFAASHIEPNRPWFRHALHYEKIPSAHLGTGQRPMNDGGTILIFSPSAHFTFHQLDLVPLKKRKKRIHHQTSTYGKFTPDYEQRKTGHAGTWLGYFPPDREKLHKTQKPVMLIQYLIARYSNPGDMVLDPTAGSCTTAIACMNTDRSFVGYELNEDIYRKAIERIGSHDPATGEAPTYAPARKIEDHRDPEHETWDRESRRLRVKELNNKDPHSAIERGKHFLQLDLDWKVFETEDWGCTYQTANKFKVLARHPRMADPDWEKPNDWYVCYMMLEKRVDDDLFLIMTGRLAWNGKFRHVSHRDLKRKKLEHFIKEYKKRFRGDGEERKRTIHPDIVDFLNTVHHGRCQEVMQTFPDESVSIVVTSPPYPGLRADHYETITEEEYPAYTVKWMEEVRRILTRDGNVLIVLGSEVHDGSQSLYIERTKIALVEAGWNYCQELIWVKTDKPPRGSNRRLRRIFEHILWFSKIKEPYTRLWAAGRPSDRIGNASSDRHPDLAGGGKKEMRSDIARHPNIFFVPVCDNAEGNEHPAQFPGQLANELIETFSPGGCVVLDCFAGSGTTLIEAFKTGRVFIGIELEEDYVKLALERLKKAIAKETEDD